MTKETKNRAVFLDRDGTINVEKGYVYKPEDFEFEPGAIEAIRLLNQAGYKIFVVSNQSGIARGYYSEAAVEELHVWLAAELEKHGARVDAFYFCPHHPDYGTGKYKIDCDCRKPSPGMLLKAAAEWNIDLNFSYMVGDHKSDIDAGHAAGVAPIFVRTGHGPQEEPSLAPEVLRAANLYEAVNKYIL